MGKKWPFREIYGLSDFRVFLNVFSRYRHAYMGAGGVKLTMTFFTYLFIYLFTHLSPTFQPAFAFTCYVTYLVAYV